jgi:CHAD domain-containing protein
MNKKQISAFVDRRFKKIDKLSAELVKHFEEEQIHSFRVEVKKLRALLRLMSCESNNPQELKIPKRLKKFYRAVGMIRVLQLQQHRVILSTEESDQRKAGSYLKWVRSETSNEMIKAYDSLEGRISFDEERRNIQKKLPGKLNHFGKVKFMLTQKNRLHEVMMGKKFSQVTLHSIRKILKDILYTKSFIAPKYRKILPELLEDDKIVTQLTDRLGELHDLSVGLGLLGKSYRNGQCRKADLPPLRAMMTEWQENRKEIARQTAPNKATKIFPELV